MSSAAWHYSLGTILKKLSKFKGKVAVVALPCQIRGIKKAAELKPHIKGKILLYLGLICDRMLTFNFQEYLINKFNIKRDDVERFEYRSKEWKGWPGDIKFQYRDGKKVFLERDYRRLTKPFFTPLGCYICADKLNPLADITFGDAWIKKFKNNKNGVSLIISRSEMGKELLKQAAKNNVVHLGKLSIDEIVHSKIYIDKTFLSSLYYDGFRSFMNFPAISPPSNRKITVELVGRLITCIDYLLSKSMGNRTTRKLLYRTLFNAIRKFSLIRGKLLNYVLNNLLT
ncbi:MAG: Coenzyme F420 hydrogenase/dehydrogenase, beta subunit C-terminal domain [Candidatus Odinarchaeia archaeon]